METAISQTAVKNIVSVALADIQPSNYNPRKNFDEKSLAELADSIRQQGVLQAIGVRPIAENRFEIVFGERRYRASQIAGLEEIPAVILDISDETAEEMAVTENLQRKDVTPIEEANAYQKLIESGRHDVQSLAVQFGKNESYIRTRLKFVSLIPEIAQLLEQDELTISVATEICRYGEDIQHDIYEKHLKEGVLYNSWRGMKASEVAKNIERSYTTDLKRYFFDKTVCLSCPHNTNNMMLFCEEGSCGNCANRKCLEEMNASYLAEKAVQLMEQRPFALLCRDFYGCNEKVVEQLVASGFEVEKLSVRPADYPEEPEAPDMEDYENDEEYAEAYKEYEKELSEYKEECEDVNRRSEAGEITLYVTIGHNDISLCYVENAEVQAVAGEAKDAVVSPIEKLEKQDKRNKEIAQEKTVEDTKKQILEVDMTETKFGADEDRMIYFFMLPFLRREHFEAMGIETKETYYYLKDEDKMNIIANLTAKQKAIIRRDFLISNFKNASGSNATASLLLDFAKKHMPDQLADIQNGHNEVYEKRHLRIEEKIAVLSVQEKAKQEANATEDGQPETEVQTEQQTEEIAA
ncbi:ParB/RepB/Spo0J family partition protein [Butyricimonas hominis]|uniref:ParB/RepB/Spo0J family partition protein n=1 Tax=Butyricimonas hominis TaxID=2763032 RepID=A0ABR7D1A8_9BACT|nr:ParB/RepB/Spo0J family partition protein [Butyricimonas hominis]MBC5621726.1 ParB/RepB/Spo0J family partition protein [Butyricimonas hominis]